MSIAPTRLYRPTVQKGSTYYTLPVPFDTTSEELQMRVSAVDIPLVEGKLVTNVVRGARVMQLSGMIVEDTPGDVLLTKDALEAFFYDAPATTFHFYRYFSAEFSYYRWFPDCICTGINFAHTSKTVYHLPYTLGIMCPIGREYVSGTYPGASSGDDALPSGSQRLYAPLIIDLDSDDGSSAVIIRNASQQTIARIKSDGTIEVVGQIIETASIA